MDWLAISVAAYFFLALEVVLNKFLLSSKRVSHPVIYTFYAGITGVFVLVFIPFGFHSVGLEDALIRFLGGIIFMYAMLAFYLALSKSEASRVTPVVGAAIPVATFFFSMAFLGERLGSWEIAGLFFLVVGGLWISYDFSPERKSRLFHGFYYSILAGLMLAVAFTIFKGLYAGDNFINVFIWTRIGAFIGILSFFLVPKWRSAIIGSLHKFKKPEKEHKSSGFIFILARALGGSGSILKEKATSFATASVTIVNALVSIEYVFVFILGVIFSLWVPRAYEEKKDWKSIAQKILAIVLITTGLFLVSKGQ